MKRPSRNPMFSFTVGGARQHYLGRDVVLGTIALSLLLFVGAYALDRFITRSGSPFIAAVISAVLVDLTNSDRAAGSLERLEVNPRLVAAAQMKANHMAANGYFAHNSPDGVEPWHWFKEVGYDYAYAGENLAMDFSESADVERAWMNSPSHRDNILNERYSEIGIATAPGFYNGRPTLYVVQMFGAPRVDALINESGDVRPQIAAQPSRAQAQAVVEAVGPVLGEAVEEPVIMERPVEPVESIPVLASEDIPWWGFLLTMPKTTLRYAYLVLGLLVIFALFIDIQLELRWHHARHAMRAGMVLATMSILFVAADWVFFAEPVLALPWSLFN